MNELLRKIESYFQSELKMPLFVVLPLSELKILVDELHYVNKIRTSDYCLGDDKDPDLSGLRQAVQYAPCPSLLLGLGDYLELRTNIADDVLMDFKSLAMQNNVAILLSMPMHDKIQKMAKSDPRIRNRVTISSSSQADDLQSQNEANLSYIANGIKEYLSEREKGKDILNIKTERCVKSTGKYIVDPNNAFDELERSFPVIKNQLDEQYGTPEQWSELHKKTSDGTHILKVVEREDFKPIKYTFLDYARGTDFDSWLYFLSLKLQNRGDSSYLAYVVEKTIKQTDLLNNAINVISNIETTDNRFKKFYIERKELLMKTDDADMTVFKSHILLKGAVGIKYLTDNTSIERKGIIESIVANGNSEMLSEIYSDLHSYLQDFRFDDEVYTDYFKQYKKQKIQNHISPEFIRTVNELAVSRPYNMLPSRISEFAHLSKNKAALIFLDAFGVEYLGYIQAKCAELSMRFEIKIVRSNLPSSTEFNKEFYDEWEGEKYNIKDLDEVKHHPEKGYDYNNEKLPIHLADELNIVSEALTRAKKILLQGKDSVVISSDHGASRLAVIAHDNLISSNGCQVKSSGRYCEGEDLPTADAITSEDKFAVIADYSRFDGSRKAAVEVHGGATLEEVLVPIITLTLADKKQNIKVELKNETIEISYKKKAELCFSISPDYDNVSISVNGRTYISEKVSNNNYRVEMEDLNKVGDYSVQIFENQNLIATKKFAVKRQGFSEKDLL